MRIVSVHTGDTDWVGVQAAQVQKHVNMPFSLFTSVNDGAEEAVAAAWHAVTGKEPVYVVSNQTVMDTEKVPSRPQPQPEPQPQARARSQTLNQAQTQTLTQTLTLTLTLTLMPCNAGRTLALMLPLSLRCVGMITEPLP